MIEFLAREGCRVAGKAQDTAPLPPRVADDSGKLRAARLEPPARPDAPRGGGGSGGRPGDTGMEWRTSSTSCPAPTTAVALLAVRGSASPPSAVLAAAPPPAPPAWCAADNDVSSCATCTMCIRGGRFTVAARNACHLFTTVLLLLLPVLVLPPAAMDLALVNKELTRPVFTPLALAPVLTPPAPSLLGTLTAPVCVMGPNPPSSTLAATCITNSGALGLTAEGPLLSLTEVLTAVGVLLALALLGVVMGGASTAAMAAAVRAAADANAVCGAGAGGDGAAAGAAAAPGACVAAAGISPGTDVLARGIDRRTRFAGPLFIPLALLRPLVMVTLL